jgi:hypothetical protein
MIVVGVDVHKHSLTAVAVDEVGRPVAEQTVGAGQLLLRWAASLSTGKAVRISGFEEWTLGDDGRVVESKGNYDSNEYDRQLEHGAPATS